MVPVAPLKAPIPQATDAVPSRPLSLKWGWIPWKRTPSLPLPANRRTMSVSVMLPSIPVKERGGLLAYMVVNLLVGSVTE